jgi:hypothetical protein
MNISTDDTFTTPRLIQGRNKFDISISGTFSGTVTLQRSKDKAVWVDVETYTTPVEKTGEAATAWFYRIGVKAGDHISGVVAAAIH